MFTLQITAIRTALMQAGYEIRSGNLAKDGVIMIPQAKGMLIVKRVRNRAISTFLTWEELEKRITWPVVHKCERCHNREVLEKGDLCPQCTMAIQIDQAKRTLHKQVAKTIKCEVCDEHVYKVKKIDGLLVCGACEGVLV